MSRTSFTGNRDVDINLLVSLSDSDLRRTCQTNKYVSELCKLELLWKKRTQVRFPGAHLHPGYTWMRRYQELVLSEQYRNEIYQFIVSGLTSAMYDRLYINTLDEEMEGQPFFEPTLVSFLAKQRKMLDDMDFRRLSRFRHVIRTKSDILLLNAGGWYEDTVRGAYLNETGRLVLLPGDF